MEKILSIILIVALILCVLSFPFLYKINGETTFRKTERVDMLYSSTGYSQGAFFSNATSIVNVVKGLQYQIDYYIYNENPVASQEYIEGEIVCVLNLIHDNETIKSYVINRLPCYYKITYWLSDSNYFTVNEIAIIFDFLDYINTLKNFENYGDLTQDLIDLYNDSLDSAFEVRDTLYRLVADVDLFFAFTKYYFGSFSLKGLEVSDIWE